MKVCLDGGLVPTMGQCLIYSFGMDLDITFEDSFWNFRKCEEHLYDPRMEIAGWNTVR